MQTNKESIEQENESSNEFRMREMSRDPESRARVIERVRESLKRLIEE